jgi:hypothetical protein
MTKEELEQYTGMGQLRVGSGLGINSHYQTVLNPLPYSSPELRAIERLQANTDLFESNMRVRLVILTTIAAVAAVMAAFSCILQVLL